MVEENRSMQKNPNNKAYTPHCYCSAVTICDTQSGDEVGLFYSSQAHIIIMMNEEFSVR